jgi:hypothetical protein
VVVVVVVHPTRSRRHHGRRRGGGKRIVANVTGPPWREVRSRMLAEHREFSVSLGGNSASATVLLFVVMIDGVGILVYFIKSFEGRWGKLPENFGGSD